MIDTMQDEDLAKADLRNHERLVQQRQPWEATYQEVDARFPNGAGGFNGTQPGAIRGARNYDATHITGNQRFAAAGVAITTPEETGYIKVSFLDEDLMKIPAVKEWCEYAGKRLYAIRHAMHTGFVASANEDWDQLGRYGTSAVWQEARPWGMVYRTLHLSETWIDVDFCGLVDTVHRCFERSARQLEDFFGKENLTPKMRDALATPGKEDTKFKILHVVRPNTGWDEDRLDHRRFPIASRYLAVDEKLFLRRAGYYTMPISVSRHATSAGELYGRSPAIDHMPTINGLNAMRHTTLRAGHKATDPALVFYNDDGVSSLATKPGGISPGFVDEEGRMMIHKVPGGEAGLPWAESMIEQERQTVRTAFVEDFYKILTDPNSRMTTTEVLEVMAKQGVLGRPFASRFAMEKQHPMTNRDLELALQNGQLRDFPPEVKEAGAWPVIAYENPLAAMARAESTAKTRRWLEGAQPLSAIDPGVADVINAEEILRGDAEAMGVPLRYVRPPEEVAALRQKRGEDQKAVADAELIEKTAGASLDLARAGQIAEAA